MVDIASPFQLIITSLQITMGEILTVNVKLVYLLEIGAIHYLIYDTLQCL
jgi:hypothetical protein